MPKKGDFKEFCKNGHKRTLENVTDKRECKECMKNCIRTWVKNNPSSVGRIKRRHRLKKKFNLSDDWFDTKLENQNNRCAICGRLFSLEDKNHTPHLDHCHVTLVPRGLLCDWCNKGLGNFQDDIDRLQKAIEYLKKYKS